MVGPAGSICERLLADADDWEYCLRHGWGDTDTERAGLLVTVKLLREAAEALSPQPSDRCDAERCVCGHFHCRHSVIWKGSQQACDDCACLEFREAPARSLPSPQDGWQPIATAPKDNKSVLLYVPLDNGTDPQLTIVRGFFAAAGTVDMDTEDEDLVNEEGYNADDAWFSESGDREPYAMMLNYAPTHWMPLPAPPVQTPTRDKP